jgi:predicted transcriptional regulator
MFGWLFKKENKDDFEQHKSAVQTALNNVKQDMGSLSKWIKHLDSQDSDIKNEVNSIITELSSIKKDIEEIKQIAVENQSVKNEPLFKQRPTAMPKQTPVYDIQTAVQTTVQAAFFTKLSVSEKAIVSILMNSSESEMKLSYEDLASMMGKDTATVRGQVNSIRQKCSGLIEEQIEKNGKKRLYVPEEVRGLLLKRVKNKPKRARNE